MHIANARQVIENPALAQEFIANRFAPASR
jgi:hypothetical protein